METKKSLILLALLFMICGCTNIETACDKISNKIIASFQTEAVDTSNLNTDELDLYNEFLTSQNEENLVINITENIINKSEFYESDANTPKMYQSDDEYFIKYKDITWDEYDDTYYAVFTIDGMQTTIYKSCVPILYKETVGVQKYNYILENKKEFSDKIDYYYKSIYDESGLVIRFHIKNNSIDYISLIHQLVYSDNINNKQKEKTVNFGLIIIILVLIIFTSYFVYKFVINKKKDIYNQTFSV